MKTKIKTQETHSCGGNKKKKTVEKVATENIRGVQKRIKTWKYSTKEQMK